MAYSITHSRSCFTILLGLVLALLTACADSPETIVARKFMKALVRHDIGVIDELVIPESRRLTVGAALAHFGANIAIEELTDGKLKISYSDLKFRPVSRSKEVSLVEVEGAVNIAYRSESLKSKPFHFNLRMEKRGKRWLVAGVE